MDKSIILDTNAYSEFRRGNPVAVDILNAAGLIILCPIVIGELMSGFSLGRKAQKNKDDFTLFLKDPKVMSLSLNDQTSFFYSEIYKKLRIAGSPIPTNDMWISAIALQLDLPVFTFDKHFTQVDGLSIVKSIQDL